MPNAVATVSHRLAPTPPRGGSIAFCGGMIGGGTRWGKAARATTKLRNGPAAKMGWTSGQESARFSCLIDEIQKFGCKLRFQGAGWQPGT